MSELIKIIKRTPNFTVYAFDSDRQFVCLRMLTFSVSASQLLLFPRRIYLTLSFMNFILRRFLRYNLR